MARDTDFWDVNAKYWASGYKKVISSYGHNDWIIMDGLFYPETPISTA
jgi:hypothetical protein